MEARDVLPRDLLIAINATDRITRAALCRLGADPEVWWRAPERDTRHVAATLGVPAAQLGKALAARRDASRIAGRELARAERRNCRIVTLLDPDYPEALRDHALPPPVLYCRGRIPDGPAVAIVGSRDLDAYGHDVAAHFGRGLAEAGLTIVSGFARGVDTAAHGAALEAEGGTTVAVLGCGLDVDYPRGSGELAAAIAERGAVISEFAFGAEPLPWRFPIRNRLIAALALGTLVVQATFRSGSLITAHQALELGRDVYAVPGRIFDRRSQGTNALIADGALIAREPRDILESLRIGVQQELFPAPAPAGAAPPLLEAKPPAGFQGKVLAALPVGEALTAEEIAAAVDATVDRVLGALLELELAGRIRREPGPVYVR